MNYAIYILATGVITHIYSGPYPELQVTSREGYIEVDTNVQDDTHKVVAGVVVPKTAITATWDTTTITADGATTAILGNDLPVGVAYEIITPEFVDNATGTIIDGVLSLATVVPGMYKVSLTSADHQFHEMVITAVPAGNIGFDKATFNLLSYEVGLDANLDQLVSLGTITYTTYSIEIETNLNQSVDNYEYFTNAIDILLDLNYNQAVNLGIFTLLPNGLDITLDSNLNQATTTGIFTTNYNEMTIGTNYVLAKTAEHIQQTYEATLDSNLNQLAVLGSYAQLGFDITLQ
jgi:hypothetical protein